MSDIEQLQRRLDQGCQTLDLSVSEEKQALLLEYLHLIKKWNRAYNLTAISEPNKMLVHHLLDSLAVAPFIKDQPEEGRFRLLDVGTGAGLPGIPLAIQFPELVVTLLDSNGKKTRFLTHTTHQLCLKNVAVEQRRVEDFRPVEPFDAVISRAFASLKDMTDNAGHLLKSTGQLWAMKGRMPHEEIEALSSQWQVEEVIPLTVPGLDAARHLVKITQRSSE